MEIEKIFKNRFVKKNKLEDSIDFKIIPKPISFYEKHKTISKIRNVLIDLKK